tara:strand:+ start:154 stop:753 length:600 start_codon:yes stop_codon:yes gene_type:complete
MARELILVLGNQQSIFEIAKIERSDLYGSKKRIFLDSEGNKCTRAQIDGDTGDLLPSGSISSSYIDFEGNQIEKNKLEAVDQEGNELSIKTSTIGSPQKLSPIEAKKLLNVRVNSVYMLTPKEIGDSLEQELAKNKAFHFPFNYYADFKLEDGILLKNENGYFALIGEMCEPQWLEEKSSVLDSSFGETESDELDFEMM